MLTQLGITPKSISVRPRGRTWVHPALPHTQNSTPLSSTPQEAFEVCRQPAPEVEEPTRFAVITDPLRSLFQAVGSVVRDLIMAPVGIAISAVQDVIHGELRDAHFSHTVEHGHTAEAQKTFEDARARLLDPNSWGRLGPVLAPTRFTVYSQRDRQKTTHPPEVGDYFRIKIPDPGPPIWMRVEKLDLTDNLARIVVRPSADPTGSSPTVVHMFGELTTNTFEVRKDGLAVTSSVTSHNETPNRDGDLWQQSVASVRTLGAWLGAKKPQWRAFTRKLLEGPGGAHQGTRLTAANAGMLAAFASMQSGKG